MGQNTKINLHNNLYKRKRQFKVTSPRDVKLLEFCLVSYFQSRSIKLKDNVACP